MISQKRLKEILHYSPETGKFTWIVRVGNVKSGTEAGSFHKSTGYILIKIEGKTYPAHRLVFLYITGSLPKNYVDHKNGNRSDNRKDNLRECLMNENLQNIGCYATNKSGFIGVSFHKIKNKWQAQIKHKSKNIHLGYFDNKEEAYIKYLYAKQNLHTFNPIPRIKINQEAVS
jgi:hypothetical protein